MKILALDTSNRAMSVAVLADGELLAETLLNQQKTHSQQLLPTIENLIALSGLTATDIDRIVVAQGPGSYTGLRIGVTTGKTLASTLHRELVGVSSLAVLAANIRDTPDLLVPVMDARRNNVFAGLYQWHQDQLQNVALDRHVALEQLMEEVAALGQPAVFVGAPAAMQEQIRARLGSQARFADGIDSMPHASRLGELGVTKVPVAIDAFVPEYLRLTEAETNWLKTHKTQDSANYVEKV